ncbi:MAG: hypothetical protein WAT12_03875 [Candidatus Nitrotoga sp.]
MAEIVTSDRGRLQELAVVGGVAIRVGTPGMQFRWNTLDAVPAFDATVPGAEAGGWNEAIAENDLEEIIALQAEPVTMLGIKEGEAAPVLIVPNSEDIYVDLRAQPLPGESLLVMVESNGVIQWYAPANAQIAINPPVLGFEETTTSSELQFRIPRSTLSRGAGIQGIEGGIIGAIVRLFRVKLIKELIDAPVRFVLDWIVNTVEKKAKPREGFRFFDRDAQYPFCTPEQISAMAGQRVLLLTHGIFSSLEGAFAGIADPASGVMQHLRGIYGNNIIGWDHWTVGKTPLENAEEMLSALYPGVRPDIVCHSRGGLVTRAMLEHPSLIGKRQSRFASVGKAIFIAGACQGSQLATLNNLNRLLNIYSAIASFPLLGGAGVPLTVIVGVLRVLAHGATRLPSIEALSADRGHNEFLLALNESHLTPTGKIVVMHANYDPAKGPLADFLDLNVDLVFGEANDMVVPFIGAETFDKWQQVGLNYSYGTPSERQSNVMHLNFFKQSGVHSKLQEELT